MRHAQLLAATAVLVVLAGCSEKREEPLQPRTPVTVQTGAGVVEGQGRAAPDFSLPTQSGEVWTLSDNIGKVVVVNFWATWCGPCVRETPAFVELQEEWADRPFVVVGVSADEEGFEIVNPFIETYGVTYPMVIDEDGSIGDAFGGVYAMPVTFVVDKEGRIAHRVVGEFPFEDMRPRLESLLEAS